MFASVKSVKTGLFKSVPAGYDIVKIWRIEKAMDDQKTIYVVSDLHMGDGGPRDNFAFDNKAQQFSLFLDFVQSKNGQLFILGDLFEFWQANISRVLTERMAFLDRLGQMQARYVIGNHDADFEELVGTGLLRHAFFERMSGPFTQTIGGKVFQFMHGHELDPFNRDGTPGWGRILSILAGIMEDRKGSPLLSAGGLTEKSMLKLGRGFMWMWNMSVNRFEASHGRPSPTDFEASLTPAQSPEKVKGILALYHKDKLQKGYDVLVAGHTHKADGRGGWYYNSGCWVGLRNHFLRIEPDASVYVCEWKNGRGQVIQRPEDNP
jgi:UDP-2,3-diacylglucosamine pyrophosphatase LpxH